MATATLIGSDAQLTWANEIRAKLYSEWATLRERALTDFDASMAVMVGMDDETDTFVAEGRATVVAEYAATEEKIFGHVEASWWINVAGRSRLVELITAAKKG